jgi:riboflavin kinase/FMN adenylyltransferase
VPTPPHFTRIEAGTALSPALAGRPRVIAIGNFDGVHLGHQAVLAAAHSNAVLTFDPHPARALGREMPAALTALPRKAELLVGLGIGEVLVKTFDDAFAALPPERFVEDLLVGRLSARGVVVGRNFRFGHARGGDLAMLELLGKKHGFDVRCFELQGDERGTFSSTRIRDALARGDLADANRVLGRPHAFSGVVAQGAQRGRTLGFPTANVEDVEEVVPARGVYAVRVDQLDASDDARPIGCGVMNVGVRPTIDAKSERRTQEAHLFDFTGDLYGARLRVHVLEHIRDETKFASLDELRAQIAVDVRSAREITSRQ